MHPSQASPSTAVFPSQGKLRNTEVYSPSTFHSLSIPKIYLAHTKELESIRYHSKYKTDYKRFRDLKKHTGEEKKRIGFHSLK